MNGVTERGRTWAIVLAAGDGTRLASLTTDRQGVTTPKQYCSLRDGRTLLDDALGRAARVAPRRRIVTVVARQHRRWWLDSFANLPEENVVVQPRNQGTAPGILLPLLSILARDPGARIVVLPSDHFVADEAALARSIRSALAAVSRRPAEIVLLGMTPDAAEPDYGWIVPAEDSAGRIHRVASFVEKPEATMAARLLRQGGAWNSFIFAGTGEALRHLYARRLPTLLDAFRLGPVDAAAASHDLQALYDSIVAADFSRDILQGSEGCLRLLQVPACGWTDLGTPARVAQVLASLRAGQARSRPAMSAHLDLSRAVLASPA